MISASGAVSYNNTTGVISLTSGNLTEATSSVLTITGGTGAVLGSGTSIQVSQASTTVSGFLSSTDWNTFNGKASALSGTTNYVAKFTSSSGIGNSQIFDNGTSVGIGTASPSYSLEVKKTGTDSTIWGYNIAQFGDATANNNGLRVGTSTSVSGLTNLVAATASAASQFAFWTYNGSAWGERVRIDSAGNVGIGRTPSAWASGFSALQLSANTAIWSGTGTTGGSYFTNNVFFDGARKYINSTFATEYQQSGGVHYFQVAGSGTAGNTISFTTAMVIANNGNVGIGTTAPQILVGSGLGIEISSAAGGSLVLSKSGNPTVDYGGISYDGNTRIHANGFIGFSLSGSRHITIHNNGNMALNTTADNGYKLYVSGTIYATGNITANSDLTLKKNLELITNPTDKLMELNGYSYQWQEDDSHQYGVIAQEVEKILPYAVSTGNDGIKGVSYNQIIPVLIEAVKEQKAKIDNLEILLASK